MLVRLEPDEVPLRVEPRAGQVEEAPDERLHVPRDGDRIAREPSSGRGELGGGGDGQVDPGERRRKALGVRRLGGADLCDFGREHGEAGGEEGVLGEVGEEACAGVLLDAPVPTQWGVVVRLVDTAPLAAPQGPVGRGL